MNFIPDGGSCNILSSSPDDLPTSPPTSSPTPSPTFDMEEAVQYDLSDFEDPKMMFFQCEDVSGGDIRDSYCEVVVGNPTSVKVTSDSWGLTNCAGNCIVACSGVCTCEIGSTDSSVDMEGECIIVDASASPSISPSESPTTSASVALEYQAMATFWTTFLSFAFCMF